MAYVCSVHLINAHHSPSLSSASSRGAAASSLAFSASLPDVVVPGVSRATSASFKRRTSRPPRIGRTFSLACSHAKPTSPSAMRLVSLATSGLFVGVVIPVDVTVETRVSDAWSHGPSPPFARRLAVASPSTRARDRLSGAVPNHQRLCTPTFPRRVGPGSTTHRDPIVKHHEIHHADTGHPPT